ncbi:hypothetical protein [Rhodococcus sp. BP22]|uniref:hypothetical protein n=1 Tax=Rhodococcus sp. BP22 TaxID=2758566 RepID=UPI001644DBC5|nr:hypothetical protein [Rhodococcus sp. BP22]
MTPFGTQVLVGIVAVASLLLGLYNLWFAHKAPVRARQRELEDELRTKIEELKAVMEKSVESIKRGSHSNPEVPDVIEQCSTSLKPMAKRLSDGELRVKVASLGDSTFHVSNAWFDVASGHKYPEQTTERKTIASETELRERIQTVLPDVKSVVAILNRKDRGGGNRSYINY